MTSIVVGCHFFASLLCTTIDCSSKIYGLLEHGASCRAILCQNEIRTGDYSQAVFINDHYGSLIKKEKLKIVLMSSNERSKPNEESSTSTDISVLGASNNRDGSDCDDLNRSETETTTTMDAPRSRTKFVIGFLFLILLLLIVLDSTIGNKIVRNGMKSYLEWFEDHPGPGLVAFIFVYFGATVLFIPGSILTLGAGFVFANAFGLGLGLLLGTLAVFVGASLGSIVSFLLARYLLRDWVGGMTKKYVLFQALDNAFAVQGYRIMALLRLSPIIPFNILNYIVGVTAVSFMHYTLTIFAILPGTILYVFLGASAGSYVSDSDGAESSKTVTYIVIAVGIVFGVLAVAGTSYYAKQELNKLTGQKECTDSDGDIEQDAEAGNAGPG